MVKVTVHQTKEVQVCTETSIFRPEEGPVQSLRLPHFSIYRQSRLSDRVTSVAARVAVETAHADYWYKYVGFDGRIVGMTTFGESAPGNKLLEHFGFTVDNIVSTVEELLED